ncbi:MAG: hypothetical protein JOZ10_18675 [Acidobacteria bacterium]|nr:hypothetical protein [Acidobacteriota bacterium]MBV9144821.1 hypothetical protein [Acidobacteriota bacterium]MBV9436035.1 hypothetical protein [Acidobacteriota bacterium]
MKKTLGVWLATVLCAGRMLATISKVQATQNFTSGGTTCVISGSSSPAWSSSGSGNLIWVELYNINNTGTTTITDNKSDTYTQLFNTGTNCNGGSQCAAWYLKNTPSGITSITITTSSGTLFCAAGEYSGLDTSSPLDVNTGLNTTASTSWASIAGSTSSSNELLVGFAANASTQTYSLGGSWSDTAHEAGFGGFLVSGTQIVSATQSNLTFNGTAGATGSSAAWFSFKAVAAGASCPHTLLLASAGCG